MKLTRNPKRKLSGAALAIWLILLVFILFIVIVGGIAITMVKTLKKIVKQPPPDDRGWVPGIGSLYGGGIVIAYTNNGPGFNARTPTGFTVTNVMIYASDELYPGNDLAHWTNCIWTGPLDQLEAAIGTNGMPMESWPEGHQPKQRFYNFCIQTNQ